LGFPCQCLAWLRAAPSHQQLGLSQLEVLAKREKWGATQLTWDYAGTSDWDAYLFNN